MKAKTLGIAVLTLAFTFASSAFVSQVIGETFTISVSIPSSEGAEFSVSKVVGNTWTSQDSTNLDFGELTLNSELGIFLPAHYFVIDVGGVGGTPTPNISVQYADTGAPAGATAQLGDRGTFAYASVTNGGNGDIVTAIDGMSLHQADGRQINNDELNGGWLRISVGIATGDENLEEGDATPFTAGDKAGLYTGTLVLTAVAS